MREELLEYYERELTYLRQMGGEFSRKHPGVAGRLLLDPTACNDPHVERLIQAFAFMAARVHLRLDDDFPQLSEALLNLLYPGYLRPIPAMTVVEMLPEPAQGKKTTGSEIPRGTALRSHDTVDGQPLHFRTAYDVVLWPLRVSQAEWTQPERMTRQPQLPEGFQTVAAARLRLSCDQDVLFSGLELKRLRFYLSGTPAVVYPLYELLAANCIEVQLQDISGASEPVVLGPENLKFIGFGNDESVLPAQRRSMDGHRLLQEYFTLPEKFLFFDLEGLDVLKKGSFGGQVDVVLLFSRFERADRQQVLELGVNEKTFRLGCTPAINLFAKTAEPIQVTQARSEYVVVPDGKRPEVIEVYSIDDVVATKPKSRSTKTLEPLHSYRYQTREEKGKVFWSATRKMNQLGERRPSTMKISVVDLKGELTDPDADVLVVRSTCTNFDQPSRLTIGRERGDFEAQGYAAAHRVFAVLQPTRSYSPPDGDGQLWRLISQLSLNYLSLSEEGRGALQEILRLHNFTGSNSLENQIRSIGEVEVSPEFAMVQSDYGLMPARGTAVDINLDEQQFTGGSAYLFCAVLDRFLGGYASMNSFAQLTARTTLRKEPMNTWPPRAGTQSLL